MISLKMHEKYESSCEVLPLVASSPEAALQTLVKLGGPLPTLAEVHEEITSLGLFELASHSVKRVQEKYLKLQSSIENIQVQ